MTTTSIIPVILSGGSGTRLWPMSRQLRPKQFLPMVDDLTLFQNTLQRLQGIPKLEDALIVCNEEHRFMVAEQLRTLNLKHQGILLEPIGRNTAPAIALAALYLSQQGKADALMLVLPADHVIQDKMALEQAIQAAAQAANDGYLATFGNLWHRSAACRNGLWLYPTRYNYCWINCQTSSRLCGKARCSHCYCLYQ